MSQENLELARRHYAILNAAFESGDLRALERHNAEFLDPDFVCKPAPVFDDTEEMHARAGTVGARPTGGTSGRPQRNGATARHLREEVRSPRSSGAAGAAFAGANA